MTQGRFNAYHIKKEVDHSTFVDLGRDVVADAVILTDHVGVTAAGMG